MDRKNQKTWVSDPESELFSNEVAYAPEIAPYVRDVPVQLAPGLRWCGEHNIIPTATIPLSGLAGYGQDGSIVVPHPRIAMHSLPRMGKRAEPRFSYTTGAVTAINYIPRKAGQKAAFAHCFGALIVEVDHEGRWWARQIQADGEGALCDLNLWVHDGIVTEAPPLAPDNVEAIVWGDVHVEVMDESARDAAWGPGGVADKLRPRVQVLHDVLDFRRRNHNDRHSPIGNFVKWAKDRECVAEEIEECAEFVYGVAQDNKGPVVVVDSNHDRALTRWLDETDYRQDPANALFYLKTQLARYEAAARGLPFHALEHACKPYRLSGTDVTFLRQDDSYTLKGIECGMHGDRGVDGRRGSPVAYADMESKVVVGHSHSASIRDGVFTVGTMSKLRLGYTRGPSTWSHTFCIIYRTGERALVTIQRRERHGHDANCIKLVSVEFGRARQAVGREPAADRTGHHH